MSCGLVVTLCGLLLQFTGKFLKMLAFGTVEYFSLVCDGFFNNRRTRSNCYHNVLNFMFRICILKIHLLKMMIIMTLF